MARNNKGTKPCAREGCTKRIRANSLDRYCLSCKDREMSKIDNGQYLTKPLPPTRQRRSSGSLDRGSS